MASKIVGRWRSGAPLERAPHQDNPTLGEHPLSTNSFQYNSNTTAVPFQPNINCLPDSTFYVAQADPNGTICPHASHIRKTQPRDQPDPNQSSEDSQKAHLTRRIVRRGCPFGPAVEDRTKDDNQDRGLAFICYQSNIQEQFEFIQHSWANKADFPKKDAGHDLIIGNSKDQRFLALPQESGEPKIIKPNSYFVIPKGGGYFFAPSIKTLEDMSKE